MSAKSSASLHPEDSRHYDNPFEDYSASKHGVIVDDKLNTIHDKFKETLVTGTKSLLQKFETNKKHWSFDDDYSLYTGTAGIAYLFYHYGKYYVEPTYITRAVEMIRSSLSRLRSKRQVTFLIGNAGPLALGAVMLHSHVSQEESQSLIAKLKALSSHVLDDGRSVSDELLYGRAGYLFSLLFVNVNISPPPFDEVLIKQVIASILKSGRTYSKARNCESPLMYAWHDSEYIGGAHGLAGILYLLLQAREYLTASELKNDINPSLQYLCKIRYPSGNFPSSLGSCTDKLVHWCHGAPSMTMLFCLAYQIFDDTQYLQVAIDCGEVVWKRGLLKKGYGICHGVAGNAYTFLSLFQQTQDPKHLYRALKFGEWCLDYGTHQTRTPDRPFSLFEGLAGTIYFLIDLQKPLLAKLPGYTV